MSSIFGMFHVIVLIVVLSVMQSTVRRKRFNAMPKSTVRMPKENTVKSKAVRASMKDDLVVKYSTKNKECHEHEVKVSSLDEKPKRRKGLWNEPSWDDELYS